MTDHQHADHLQSRRAYQRIGLWLGPAVFALLLVLPPPDGLTPQGWRTAATAVLMAVWWATEAIPVAATSLVPLVLFPLLGVAGVRDTAAPYANPLIFLFLGGFLIALGMQRWDLHRRIALAVLARTAGRPVRVVAGFMIATAGLSMWVSNTATTLMMLPIATSVIAVMAPKTGTGDRDQDNFAVALLLGVAYAASIGGLGTLIGTPPNALLAAFMLDRYGVEIGFAAWMLVGLPVVAVMLPLAWLVLTRIAHPFRLAPASGGETVIAEAREALGPLTTPEKRVAIVAVATAAAWVARPLLNDLPGLAALSDTGIALAGALALFLLPAGKGSTGALLDWEWGQRLPWGVLILFGGGLSLAAAIAGSGLAEWIGTAMTGLGTMPMAILLVAAVAVVILLTELTSNTATAAAFLPVLGALAAGAGYAPLDLAAPAALAASCAFMLPVATPPNAIVYGSGAVTIPQMVRAGVLMNLAGVAVIATLSMLLIPLVFGG